MSVQTAPCDWQALYPDCPEGQLMPEPLASLPASGVEIYEEMAATYLWNWTEKQFGLCSHTIRPCRQPCGQGQSTFWGSGPRYLGAPWTPVLIDGLWYNVGCGLCGDACGCGGSAPLRIPGPIDSVEQILEDGVPLSTDSYHVDNHTFLVRDDGQRWSECGLEITYTRGVPVPIGGQVAAGRLAVELAKAACGDKSCGLPKRVQTVTRQGVSIAMLDAFDDIDKGHTGIWSIDSWISSITKPIPSFAVLSPDYNSYPARQRTS